MKLKIKFIDEETEKLQTFIDKNDGLTLTENNLDDFIATSDNFSKQLFLKIK